MIGMILIDLPGKYALERWLITRRPVRKSVNWLRHRANRAPLVTGNACDDSSV